MLVQILLRAGIVGEPLVVICSYHDKLKIKVKNHIFEDAKLCEFIQILDANNLYLFYSGLGMLSEKSNILIWVKMSRRKMYKIL